MIRLAETDTAVLGEIVGTKHIRTDAEAIKAAWGAWSPALVKARQISGEAGGDGEAGNAVVFPADAGEVAQIVTWANANKTPLVVVGGASNTVGSTARENGRVAVSLSRLQAVEWEEENLLVHAGAGVVLGDLEDTLNAHDYTLGHLPHSFRLATIGGCVAANAIGILAGRYGRQSDLTIGLEVVLPMGQIIRTNANNAPDANAAFPLHDLFGGSEGGFGIITQATLQMRPAPRVRAWAAFSFAAFDDGIDALRLIYRSDSGPRWCGFSAKPKAQRG